jgi:hypothetical protein
VACGVQWYPNMHFPFAVRRPPRPPLPPSPLSALLLLCLRSALGQGLAPSRGYEAPRGNDGQRTATCTCSCSFAPLYSLPLSSLNFSSFRLALPSSFATASLWLIVRLGLATQRKSTLLRCRLSSSSSQTAATTAITASKSASSPAAFPAKQGRWCCCSSSKHVLNPSRRTSFAAKWHPRRLRGRVAQAEHIRNGCCSTRRHSPEPRRPIRGRSACSKHTWGGAAKRFRCRSRSKRNRRTIAAESKTVSRSWHRFFRRAASTAEGKSSARFGGHSRRRFGCTGWRRRGCCLERNCTRRVCLIPIQRCTRRDITVAFSRRRETEAARSS